MKSKKLKLSAIFAWLFASAILAVVVLNVASYGTNTAFAAEEYGKDTYTVCSDEEYYSETTYYLTESAYEKATEKDNVAAQPQTTALSVEDEEADSEFVLAASKRVWVYEETNEDGEVAESRLLTKSEIEQAEEQNASVSSGVSLLSTEIGTDNTSKKLLNIDMTVKYDNSTGEYLIEGNASWKNKLVYFWETERAAEEDYVDYIGISWGGNGALEAQSKSISGYYYNGKEVLFSQKVSDSYEGFIWEFNEKSGYMGKEMEKATAKLNIAPIYASQGKKTNVKMTYIHTYGKISGEIGFEVNSKGEAAASLKLSETEKQWDIEIDVPGIVY